METSCRRCSPKAKPRALLSLVNNTKQPLQAKKILKIRYFEGGKKLRG